MWKESVEPKFRKKPGYGKTSQHTRSAKDLIPLPDCKVVDSIVTPAQYEAVQGQLEAKKRNSQRNAKRFYMLVGLLFCAEDGRRPVGTPNGSRGTYKYKCKARGGEILGAPLCHCRRINGPKTDEIVWETVIAYPKDPQKFEREIARNAGPRTVVS